MRLALAFLHAAGVGCPDVAFRACFLPCVIHHLCYFFYRFLYMNVTRPQPGTVCRPTQTPSNTTGESIPFPLDRCGSLRVKGIRLAPRSSRQKRDQLQSCVGLPFPHTAMVRMLTVIKASPTQSACYIWFLGLSLNRDIYIE